MALYPRGYRFHTRAPASTLLIGEIALTGAEATFGPRLAELLPAGAQALAAFRVGYPVRDAKRSPRRALSTVTR